MFNMEHNGTYSESPSIEEISAKNGKSEVDLHIRISRENYIFMKKNFNRRFSETINKLLDYLRTEQPAELKILRIGMPGEGFEPPTMRSSAARSPWLSYPGLVLVWVMSIFNFWLNHQMRGEGLKH